MPAQELRPGEGRDLDQLQAKQSLHRLAMEILGADGLEFQEGKVHVTIALPTDAPQGKTMQQGGPRSPSALKVGDSKYHEVEAAVTTRGGKQEQEQVKEENQPNEEEKLCDRKYDNGSAVIPPRERGGEKDKEHELAQGHKETRSKSKPSQSSKRRNKGDRGQLQDKPRGTEREQEEEKVERGHAHLMVDKQLGSMEREPGLEGCVEREGPGGQAGLEGNVDTHHEDPKGRGEGTFGHEGSGGAGEQPTQDIKTM